MKRVSSACICQTLHFMLKEDAAHDHAVRLVRQEVQQYKQALERRHTPYKIVSETEEPDGSILLQVIRQYNMHPVGNYLD